MYYNVVQSKYIDRKYHMLTIKEVLPGRRVKCLCDCGSSTIVYLNNLTRKKPNTTSCGCVFREKILFANRTHGHSSREGITPTYYSWAKMLQRCNNPNSTQYKWYGARGIKVCTKWLNFECFLSDMGERPSTTYSLDRINNDGDYYKENCKWSTASEQCKNRRARFDKRTQRNCLQCAILFVPPKKDAKYCSRACVVKSSRKIINH